MKIKHLAGLCIAFATAAVASAPGVPYPSGYRDWYHVKSIVIEEGHPLFGSFGGIHQLYANRLAIKGYRTGHFPDGAVIVFDLLDAKLADHAITEGARKVIGVMHKDAKRYSATGGWGFEAFGGGARGSRVVGANAATACYACHTSQQGHDYVFSRLRD